NGPSGANLFRSPGEILNEPTLSAKVANWRKAKKARTSSIFSPCHPLRQPIELAERGLFPEKNPSFRRFGVVLAERGVTFFLPTSDAAIRLVWRPPELRIPMRTRLSADSCSDTRTSPCKGCGILPRGPWYRCRGCGRFFHPRPRRSAGWKLRLLV